MNVVSLDLGELAYRAYSSAIDRVGFPHWSEVPEASRRAWAKVETAIAEETMRAVIDALDDLGKDHGETSRAHG